MGGVILISVIILLPILILVGLTVSIFNGLVELAQNTKRAWANIDVLLKQRNDEIPNLVATVKVYMHHEKNLLENIVNARTKMLNFFIFSQLRN